MTFGMNGSNSKGACGNSAADLRISDPMAYRRPGALQTKTT